MTIFDPTPPDLMQHARPWRSSFRASRSARRQCLLSRVAGLGALMVFTLVASTVGMMAAGSADEHATPSSIELCLHNDTPAVEIVEAPRVESTVALSDVQPLGLIPFIADDGVVYPYTPPTPWRVATYEVEPVSNLEFSHSNVLMSSTKTLVRHTFDQLLGWSNDAMTHLVSTGCAYVLFHRAFHLPWEFW